jgi:hypothetical protein
MPGPLDVLKDPIDKALDVAKSIDDGPDKVGKAIVDLSSSVVAVVGDVLRDGGDQVAERLTAVATNVPKVFNEVTKHVERTAEAVLKVTGMPTVAQSGDLTKAMTSIVNTMLDFEKELATRSSLKPVKGTLDATATLRALPGGPGVEVKLHLDLERV